MTTRHPPTRLGAFPEAIWWLAAVLAFWSCGYAVVRADDLWWHLAAGRWMLAEGALTRTDTFSFTAAGTAWLNDAWLSDIVFALWERAFGTQALVWWKWSLVVGTFGLLFGTLRRLGRVTGAGAPSAAAAAFLAAAVGAMTAGPFLDMRPQLYTFLGIVLVLHGSIGRPTPAWWLPLVFAVWANLHAGFIFGLGCLAVCAAPALWSAGSRRSTCVTVALSIGACLLNPYGAAALSRPLRYAFDRASPFHALAEWWPPFRPGGVESPFYPFAIGVFGLAVVVALLHRDLRPRPTTWIALAIGTGTLAMSLTSRRFVPVFALGQSLLAAIVTARVLAPIVQRLPSAVPALAALALGVSWLAPLPRAGYAFHYLTAEDHFPIETATFIETNALDGNVFAQYGWAGYLLMRSSGRMKVYVDGRADAVYPDDVFVRYEQASLGRPGWMEIIENSAADWVLWPRHRPWGALPGALMSTGRWQQVHADAVAVLLRRTAAGAPPSYAPTPESAERHAALGTLALDQERLEIARRELTAALAAKPHLRRACNGLAMTEARAGNIDAARAVMERCEAAFPLPARVAWFEEQLDSLGAGR